MSEQLLQPELQFNIQSIQQAYIPAEDAPEPYTLVARISSAKPNRNNVRINQLGIDWTNFQKNPVLLPFHDAKTKPVGRAYGFNINESQTVCKVEFFNDTVDSQELARYYKLGRMKGFSIGISPIDFNKAEDGIWDINKCDALELSCVTIPADADALVLRNMLNETKSNFLQREFSRQLFDIYDEELKKTNEKIENAINTINETKNILDVMKLEKEKIELSKDTEAKNIEILEAINKVLNRK